MRAIELFAGVGGFRLGLERNNIEVVWANEWDKYAADIYDKNFEGEINRESITDVRAEDVPEHDLICGGFPCQAFSIAGKRKGFDETRGTLFFDIMRIAQHHRTPYLFLENVKGLLNHDGGRTFETIIRTLDELGYDCQWQVLNSKDFGVPQNRERVFIIGHLRGQPRPEVFPLGEYGETYTAESEGQEPGRWGASVVAGYGTKSDGQYVAALTERRTEESKSIRREARRSGRDWSPRRGKQLEPRTDGIANTVTATQTVEQLVSEPNRIRRLTPMECERLQGFPDGHTEGVSDTQRYKMMGNAVTVNVIEAIASKLPVGRPGMIIGDGDIASVLPDRDDLLFFASGVSNSQETRASEYAREKELLMDQPKDAHIVYFSSLAIFYSNTAYTRHKRQMEGLIRLVFPSYTIIRLGNITWGTNPRTLINYLKAHPEAEIQDVYRYVIDRDEFLHWIGLIPGWNVEMNLPGKRMKVQEIKDEYA